MAATNLYSPRMLGLSMDVKTAALMLSLVGKGPFV